jgi:hypothetical protein
MSLAPPKPLGSVHVTNPRNRSLYTMKKGLASICGFMHSISSLSPQIKRQALNHINELHGAESIEFVQPRGTEPSVILNKELEMVLTSKGKRLRARPVDFAENHADPVDVLDVARKHGEAREG